MFDSRQYEFADMTAFMGNRDVTGFRGIKYTTKQEKEAFFAKGNEAHSIQRGNKSIEGEIYLSQSELEALTANGEDLLDLQLNITITYGNPSKGDMIVVDVIYGVEFTEEAKEMKQGDKFMEVTLPFIALKKEKKI